jgi:hypothetical protein
MFPCYSIENINFLNKICSAYCNQVCDNYTQICYVSVASGYVQYQKFGISTDHNVITVFICNSCSQIICKWNKPHVPENCTIKTALDNNEQQSVQKVCFCVFFPNKYNFLKKQNFKVLLGTYIRSYENSTSPMWNNIINTEKISF